MRMNHSEPYVQIPIPICFDSLPFPSSSNPHPHHTRPFLKIIVNILYIQVKSPPITHFELPFQIWTTASLLLLLIYTSSAPPPYSDSYSNHASKFWWLARAICPGILPNWMIPFSWGIVVIVHSGEGAYAATRAYKHHMPWHIAVRFTPFTQNLWDDGQ
jgi:hypothetical protein